MNISSGNGLVPLGNKSLPEPMFTQVYVATWRDWVRMDELKKQLSCSFVQQIQAVV